MTELQLMIKREFDINPAARVVDIARKLGASPSMVGNVRQFVLFGKKKVACDYKKKFLKVKIPAECPTCHIEHLVVWDGKVPKKKPMVYCKRHKSNRKKGDDSMVSGYAESTVPAKSKNHMVNAN